MLLRVSFLWRSVVVALRIRTASLLLLRNTYYYYYVPHDMTTFSRVVCLGISCCADLDGQNRACGGNRGCAGTHGVRQSTLGTAPPRCLVLRTHWTGSGADLGHNTGCHDAAVFCEFLYTSAAACAFWAPPLWLPPGMVMVVVGLSNILMPSAPSA
jgi:hypothetical protein